MFSETEKKFVEEHFGITIEKMSSMGMYESEMFESDIRASLNFQLFQLREAFVRLWKDIKKSFTTK